MCSRTVVITLVFIVALIPNSYVQVNALPHHSLAKRSSFFDIDCKGVFEKSVFYKLDRICEDCYNLFKEPQLHTLCKKDCFTSVYFKGCIDALQLTDEIEHIKELVQIINGADPKNIIG